MGPARLHHADLRLGKVVNHLHEPVGRGHEVGVEDGDVLALGYLEARIQCSCLVAMAICPMDVDDGISQGCVAGNNAGSHLTGFVG